MTPATIEAAISFGEPDAQRELVRVLSPVILNRVRRLLARTAPRRSDANAHQDEDDLVQDVLLSLFDKDGHTLRTWDAQRGATLKTFIGVVTEHRVSSILRRGRNRLRVDIDAERLLERVAGGEVAPERRVASCDFARRLLGRLRSELSTRGFEIFRALFIEEDSVESVCEAQGMTAVAVWAWRSRLKKRIRELAAELDPPVRE